jgi:hypothetical protein
LENISFHGISEPEMAYLAGAVFAAGSDTVSSSIAAFEFS